MASTPNAVQVPQEWTLLADISSVDATDSVVLQNLGIPGDIISVAVAMQQPVADFLGVALGQLNPMQIIENPSFPVWVKYYRTDDITAYPARTGLIQAQKLDDSIREHFNIGSGGSGAETTNMEQMNSLIYLNQSIESQLKLLNLKIEEAFETTFTEVDL